MKHIITTFLLCLISLTSSGQIAHWKVSPTFDDVKPLRNGLIDVTVGNSHGLYNSVGEMVLPLEYDSIGDFRDNQALLFNDSKFVGFVGSNGKLVDLSAKGYTLEPYQEFFSDGFLTVKKEKKFYFIDTNGNEVAGPFANARPYVDGIAAITGFVDLVKKPDDTYFAFMGTDQILKKIPDFDKTDDISFISSFRDGKAVGVYKRKAYFITDSLTVIPISVDSVASKKSAVTFDSKVVTPQSADNGYAVVAKNAVLSFNELMQLNEIEAEDNILYSFTPSKMVVTPVISEFKSVSKDGKMGLVFNNEVLLPAQFSDVKMLEGKYALVNIDGKWGIITVDPNNTFQFKLNNNEHIGFNHRFYIAKLATLMPSYIKCSNTTVYSKSPDCEIQVESRNEIENIERNTLTYDCKLSIPPTLTDSLSTQEYTYSLKYDGLQSVDYKVSIPEWYVKYYEVELSNTNFTVNANETIAVEFDLVKTDAARNDDTNYFKTVELITPDNENIPLNKITENHYSFRVESGDQEKLSFIIKITESGCPSIEYPFEMVFTKPTPKSKVKTAVVKPVKSTQKTEVKEEKSKKEEIYVPK